MRRVPLLGLACSLSLVLLGGCSSTPPSTQQVPRFERGACALKLGQGFVDGQNIQCGFLIVRQDRANANSPTIKLAVAILKPSSTATASDPVIYLSGGPGESPLTDFAPLFTPDGVGYFFGNRDLIIFDSRGVGGYSQPSLDCPELRTSVYGALGQNLTPDQYDALYRAAMQQCHARLIEAGINLSLFTTYTSAADVHDLIEALGYQQVNLYGGSYGTRLALEVMRDFPQHVRSVVLDSTLPPQVDLFTSVPASAMRSFDTLFNACAASATCNRSYPQLQSTFYALANTLNAHPLALHDVVDPFTNQSYTVLLNGWRFVELFFLSLYDTTMLPQLPADIYAARSDNTAPLTALYNAEMFTEDAISRGMWYSVECNDDAPFGTSQDVEMAEQTFAPPIRADDLFHLRTRLGICQFWNVKAAAATEKQPAVSAIPTLILEGEYDPITLPANGNLAARTLSHSDALLFPGTGHGVNFGPSACPKDIVLAFLATPTQLPDSRCIASMSEPAFT
jgi:pimeloyl-ACP methyl ester carboxylesterase